MTPAVRLGLFALGLALTFLLALGIGAAVGPLGSSPAGGSQPGSHMAPR
jgi:hypothetical protein